MSFVKKNNLKNNLFSILPFPHRLNLQDEAGFSKALPMKTRDERWWGVKEMEGVHWSSASLIFSTFKADFKLTLFCSAQYRLLRCSKKSLLDSKF